MDRRNFLRGFGLIGAMVAAPTATNALSKLEIKTTKFDEELDKNPTNIVIRNKNTEVARIDSSGNFGIGVTPSNWSGSESEVKLTVGTDGNLYVKENHKWRRI